MSKLLKVFTVTDPDHFGTYSVADSEGSIIASTVSQKTAKKICDDLNKYLTQVNQAFPEVSIAHNGFVITEIG